MSNWEISSIICFFLITIVLVFLGRFVTRLINHYYTIKAKIMMMSDIKSYEAVKNLPASMRRDGSVRFAYRSVETLGTYSGKPIYKFYIDDHDITWVFDGVSDRTCYQQRRDDPIVRIFVGECLYIIDPSNSV